MKELANNSTNEDLIEFAKEQCEIFPEDSEMGKYLRETIKILQAESCEDCVSRKDIYFKLTNGAYPNETTEQFIDRLVKELKAMPPVAPTRNKGKWIDRWDKILLCEDKNCSICGFLSQTTYNYCPNCGAEMESEV